MANIFFFFLSAAFVCSFKIINKLIALKKKEVKLPLNKLLLSQFKVRSAFPLIHSKRSKDMYSTKCNVEIRLVSLGYVMALSLPLFILIYVVLS